MHIFTLGSGDFCHLLITFATSLAPDQDRSGLIQTILHSDSVPEIILEKIYFEKVSRRQQKHAKLPNMHRVK